MGIFIGGKVRVVLCFKQFLTLAEYLLACKMGTLRFDWGGDLILMLLVERGIKHQCTMLYTPQQNGVVERKNGACKMGTLPSDWGGNHSWKWRGVCLKVGLYHIIFDLRLSCLQHMYLTGVPLKHYTLSLHMRLGMAASHLFICVFFVVGIGITA